MSILFSEAGRGSATPTPADNFKVSAAPTLVELAAKCTTVLAIIACAAVAGFFYAYACSVMYGLNDSAPSVALEAMQGINRTVRNPIFALSFFGTALLLPLAATLAFMAGLKKACFGLVLAALAYIGGGFVLTMAVNVPMNNALAVVDVSALTDPTKV